MGRGPAVLHRQIENETHSHRGEWVRCKSLEVPMARSETRPVVTLRSTAGTGQSYVTRKSRRNTPDRLVLRKFDPVVGRHVPFREER
ncbi:hypothetical protein GCM10010433_28410 [Streptomyces pulveraceus]